MALLSNSKSLAISDLDSSISHLQNYDSDTALYYQTATEIENNINFAERIGLLTQYEAQNYRDRVKKIKNEFDRRQREKRDVRQSEVEKKDFIKRKKEQFIINKPTQERVTNTSQHKSRSTDLERSR